LSPGVVPQWPSKAHFRQDWWALAVIHGDVVDTGALVSRSALNRIDGLVPTDLDRILGHWPASEPALNVDPTGFVDEEPEALAYQSQDAGMRTSPRASTGVNNVFGNHT
jgi:hypothetical protein